MNNQGRGVKPAEWVLVPREPTPEMMKAARYHWGPEFDNGGYMARAGRYDDGESDERNRAVWAQMIEAASPSPEGTRERGDRIGTHGVGCERWGYRHYECAVRRIEELEAAALTLPPVAGVDREAVAKALREWLPLSCGIHCERESTRAEEDQAYAEAADEILALVSPLEGKGEGGGDA